MQVRQYGCALIGDVVKAAKEYMRPYIIQVIKLLVPNLRCDPKERNLEFTICNNCSWTMGEIVMTYPELVPQYVEQCAAQLVKLLDTDSV